MRRTKAFLDPKTCFDLWIETSSVYKVAKVLDNQGIVNPKSGRAPSHMAVWGSAWRYVLLNLADGRKQVEAVWKANGELLTDQMWYPMVISKAKYLYTPKKFKEFIDKHSYLTPYL